MKQNKTKTDYQGGISVFVLIVVQQFSRVWKPSWNNRPRLWNITSNDQDMKKVIYPVDSVIQPPNKSGEEFKDN